MIHDLKSYPTYKSSGVPWMGEVPEHWELVRLGTLLRERNELNTDGRITEVLSVLRERGVIPYSEKGNIGNKKSEDISRYKIVRPNDIVVNSMNVIIGSVGLSRYTGCLSPVYYVLTRRSESDDPRYLNFYFQTKPFQKNLVRIGNGILSHRMRIPMELLKNEIFSKPPVKEQVAIAHFLDYMDRRIRRYIHAKQKMIKLLEEQKQAIIHRAVTRGLDLNVRFKPSGVEWLGVVPMLWNEALLGRCLQRIDQGWSPVTAEGDILTDQWAVLTLSSVKRGVFNATAIKPIPISAKIPDDIEIKDRDLLLTRSNTRELVGDACIVQSVRPRTVICDLIYRLIPEPTIFEPSFLMFQLLSPFGRSQIERDARGSSGTMPKISQRHIRTWRVLVPPLEEQRSIVETIENSTKNINDAMIRTKTEISLLREYHIRMITDVVTGKLDVREAAARLPTETEDQEPLAEPESTNIEDDTVDDLDEALEEGSV